MHCPALCSSISCRHQRDPKEDRGTPGQSIAPSPCAFAAPPRFDPDRSKLVQSSVSEPEKYLSIYLHIFCSPEYGMRLVPQQSQRSTAARKKQSLLSFWKRKVFFLCRSISRNADFCWQDQEGVVCQGWWLIIGLDRVLQACVFRTARLGRSKGLHTGKPVCFLFLLAAKLRELTAYCDRKGKKRSNFFCCFFRATDLPCGSKSSERKNCLLSFVVVYLFIYLPCI